MKKALLLMMISLLCVAFLTASGLAESRKYIHPAPVFSFEYPTNYQAGTLQSATEVARFFSPNLYKLPMIVAHVSEQKEDFKPTDPVQEFVERMKTTIPGTADFKIIEEKEVKLNDGSTGYLFKINWKWVDGITAMETILLSGVKADQVITLTGTAFSNQKHSAEVLAICMTLNLKQVENRNETGI